MPKFAFFALVVILLFLCSVSYAAVLEDFQSVDDWYCTSTGVSADSNGLVSIDGNAFRFYTTGANDGTNRICHLIIGQQDRILIFFRTSNMRNQQSINMKVRYDANSTTISSLLLQLDGSIHFEAAGAQHDINSTLSADTWYAWGLEKYSADNFNFYIFDEQLNELESHTNLINADKKPWGPDLNVQLILWDYNAIPHNSHYDEIRNDFGPPPDVNIWRVNGYDVAEEEFPLFSAPSDTNLMIDFNVSNPDNNRMTVDLNYSDSNVMGTGSVIVEDLNLDGAICDDLNFAAGTRCGWEMALEGVADGNYYILANVEITGESYRNDFDAADNNFRVVAPSINMWFRDENTYALLSSLTIEFDGEEYTTGPDGNVVIYPLSYETFEISAWEDDNYTVRYFEFDVNQDTSFDVNLFVLQDLNGQDIDFQFYDTDQTTLINSERVYVLHDENISSIRTTSATGTTSFFIDPDDNYVFQIGARRYYPTTLTIQIPKDEESLAPITPYDITLTGLGLEQWVNQSAVITHDILSNTVEDYIFDVNAGLVYYSRRYFLSLQGNPATYSLQPYLVRRADSGDFVFYVKDSLSLSAIEGITIIIERSIPGEGTAEVLNVETDAAGTASISLLFDTSYEVEFYYADTLVHSATIRPTPASLIYQILLDISSLTLVSPTVGRLVVNFDPDTHYLLERNNGSVDVNISISFIGKTLGTITVWAFDTNGALYGPADGNHFTGPWTDGNTIYYNVDTNDLETQHGFYVRVDVNATDGNTYTVSSVHWAVILTYEYNLSYRLDSFADEHGQIVTSFIALLFTFLIVGSILGTSILPHDPLFLTFLILALMFFFLTIGFITIEPVLFIVIFTVFIVILTRAVMG